MEIFFIIAIVVLVIGGIAYGAYLAKLRRDAMQQLAQTHNLQFTPAKDYSLASRFGFLNKLAQGSNRYAYNILSGHYKGHPILVFDYHYETYSTDSKGRRKTSHHYFSFFILNLPAHFPELIITKEGFFSKVAQFFGYDDIDFESAEFSKKFVVRSPDKKFAYDFCNARMIDYLLDNRDLQIEVDGSSLAFFFGRCLSVDDLIPNMDRMLEVRERIPDYVFSRR